MSISEIFTEVKFTKSVAGYSAKEVDAFLSDMLPKIAEQEQILSGMRVKLEAFEKRREEIAATEQNAKALLENAEYEAKITEENAKKKAESMLADASVGIEVQTRAAASHAAKVISDAEKEADGIVSEAKKNSERIIAAADAQARAMLEQVKEFCEEEKRKAQELSNECAAFEASFKELVAKTAKELSLLKEKAPMPAANPVSSAPKDKPQAVTAKKEPTVKEDSASEQASKAEQAAEEEQAAKDISFAGTKPFAAQGKKESTPRRLYDTVTVTYDDEFDFSGVRDIMKNGSLRKSPTHFSE